MARAVADWVFCVRYQMMANCTSWLPSRESACPVQRVKKRAAQCEFIFFMLDPNLLKLSAIVDTCPGCTVPFPGVAKGRTCRPVDAAEEDKAIPLRVVGNTVTAAGRH